MEKAGLSKRKSRISTTNILEMKNQSATTVEGLIARKQHSSQKAL